MAEHQALLSYVGNCQHAAVDPTKCRQHSLGTTLGNQQHSITEFLGWCFSLTTRSKQRQHIINKPWLKRHATVYERLRFDNGWQSFMARVAGLSLHCHAVASSHCGDWFQKPDISSAHFWSLERSHSYQCLEWNTVPCTTIGSRLVRWYGKVHLRPTKLVGKKFGECTSLNWLTFQRLSNDSHVDF